MEAVVRRRWEVWWLCRVILIVIRWWWWWWQQFGSRTSVQLHTEMSGSLSPTLSLTCSPTLASPRPPPTFCHWEAASSRGSGSCRQDLDHPGDAGSCLVVCSPSPIPSALSTLRCDAQERSDILLGDSLVTRLDSSWGSVFAICEFLLVLFFIPFYFFTTA